MPQSIRVAAAGPELLQALALDLRDGFALTLSNTRPSTYLLRHRPGLDPEEVLRRIAPLRPHVEVEPRLDVDFELSLGDREPLIVRDIVIRHEGTRDEPFEGLGRLLGLELLRRQRVRREDAPLPDCVMRFGGVQRVVRDLIKWRLARLGCSVPEDLPCWPEHDFDVFLYLPSPERMTLPRRARYPVELATDDPEQGAILASQLEAAGFRVSLTHTPGLTRFKVRVGILRDDSRGLDASELRLIIQRFVGGHEVDQHRFPLEYVTGDRPDTEVPRVELPLRRLRERDLFPWAGDHPERFRIRLHTTRAERELLTPFADALRAAGFRRVKVKTSHELGPAPRAALRAVRSCPRSLATLREVLGRGPVEGLRLPVLTMEDGPWDLKHDTHDIDLYLPPLALAGEGADPAPSGPATLPRCHIVTESGTIPIAGLAEALRPVTRSVTCVARPVTETVILHGPVSARLLAFVHAQLEEALGEHVKVMPKPLEREPDIWVEIGLDRPRDRRLAANEEPRPSRSPTWYDWRDQSAEPRPFVEDLGGTVRIGHLSLPKVSSNFTELIPSASDFATFCLDQTTAETVAHVAGCASSGEPCLLEGPTSTSKTSSILYVASLIGQPVARMNLSGQTETGELVGRYMPTETGWRFREGILLRAMREGLWLVLDELNLAEPQILERINSVLETPPSLVLTEHDDRSFGRAGLPIHPGFRLFATMNPAEYAGRSALSPAWRDRWLGHRQVGAATEEDHRALLLYLVTGEHPEVVVEGRPYSAMHQPAPMPALGRLLEVKPALRDVLERLASFHAGLEAAAQGGGSRRLGGGRKERYVFTRRSLLGLMNTLERHWSAQPRGFVGALGAALRRYYLDRLAPGDDRAVANDLLDAVDLDPSAFRSRTTAPPEPPAKAPTPEPPDDDAKDAADAAADRLLARLLDKVR